MKYNGTLFKISVAFNEGGDATFFGASADEVIQLMGRQAFLRLLQIRRAVISVQRSAKPGFWRIASRNEQACDTCLRDIWICELRNIEQLHYCDGIVFGHNVDSEGIVRCSACYSKLRRDTSAKEPSDDKAPCCPSDAEIKWATSAVKSLRRFFQTLDELRTLHDEAFDN